MSGGSGGKNSGINIATVLVSAGIAAVVSAVIVTIGVVGTSSVRSGAESVAQPTIVNLGAAQTAAASSGAPVESSAPSSSSAPVDSPAVPQPPVGVPTTAVTQTQVPAETSTRAPVQSTQAASPDAAPQNQTPNLNGSRAEYLYVRSERPTARTMEWQFAAFWNPRLPMDPKLAVTYRGDSAKVREQMTTIMQSSQMYDFFSIRGSAVGQPQISGSRMTITYQGLMAGFPIQTLRYHYVRENGLWKFDWKANCQEIKCMGNPDFGY